MSVNDASWVVIDDSRVMLLIEGSLTDNSRGVIYDRNMFKVQATAAEELHA
jgi:hypothetical protein